jgi:hypothetical protein
VAVAGDGVAPAPLPSSRLPALAFGLCAAGLALHLYTVAFKSSGGFNVFLVALFFWSCTPYAIAAVLARFKRTQALAAGAAAACLVGDAVMHYGVFIAPKGSTAALGLLFMPMWNLVAVGPLGALLAWGALKAFAVGRQ